jgi:purine nucleosidase
MLTHLWIDCDPGHDDAFALLLAMHTRTCTVLGVSTTAGNQTLSKTTTNALRVLRAVGRPNIPVVAGCARPILGEGAVCPEIHGESGLNVLASDSAINRSFVLLASGPDEAIQSNGILFMSQSILASPVKVTLVATGCLTNVALLIRVFPETLRNVDRVVFLGGTYQGPCGNIAPAAEFNVLLDPQLSDCLMCDKMSVL